MARRSPPRKVTYFEPVPPRLARDTIIGSTFEVGRGAAAFEPVLRIPGICCRLENPIIEPVVVDACWLEMRRHFGTRRKEGTHSAFGGIGDRMGAAHRKIAIHFKMKLDKDAIACIARTQVMHCPDARAGKDRLHDAEVLDLLLDRVSGLPVLLVVTFRPEFQQAWSGQPHVTVLALNRWSLSNAKVATQ